MTSVLLLVPVATNCKIFKSLIMIALFLHELAFVIFSVDKQTMAGAVTSFSLQGARERVGS